LASSIYLFAGSYGTKQYLPFNHPATDGAQIPNKRLRAERNGRYLTNRFKAECIARAEEFRLASLMRVT
jgi:hypothetical protein